MPILKVFKTEQYATISNQLLNDPSLSLRAKGLLCYLISKPANWNVNVNHLNSVCKEGKDAIYSTINELVDAGYIVRVKTKDPKGKFVGVDYHVYESPQRENPDTDCPDTEKPDNNKDRTEINTESNKVPVSPATQKSIEEIIRERKIQFLKQVIDFAAENVSKYPKLMYVEFSKYWVEQSTGKKLKLRFEDQRFFDIGRRLSTWQQKSTQQTIAEQWSKEDSLGTLNELF